MKKLLVSVAVVGATMLTTGCQPYLPVPPGVTVFEDGSGRAEDGTTYPSGSFYWDCATMGNMICG